MMNKRGLLLIHPSSFIIHHFFFILSILFRFFF
jgi:hypothetical protein